MTLNDELRCHIGEMVTVKYWNEKKDGIKSRTGKLVRMKNCFTISIFLEEWGEAFDYCFCQEYGENIYQILDSNNQIIYENKKLENEPYKNVTFDFQSEESYRIFGEEFLDYRIFEGQDFIENTMIGLRLREQFQKHVFSPENNISYWYDKVKDLGFITPKTEIYSLDNGTIKALEKYLENKKPLYYQAYAKKLENLVKNSSFDFTSPVFIKTGTLSNKFNFDNCKIKTLDELPQKYAQIYATEIFRARRGHPTNELAIREFISTKYSKESIYNGMALNAEFRVFYDFDSNKVFGMVNYWDSMTMRSSLGGKDYASFLKVEKELNDMYEFLSPILKEECNEKLKNAKLKGQWSVDFMWNGREFVLIDMAHAQSSHYWNRFQHLIPGGIDKAQFPVPDVIVPSKVYELKAELVKAREEEKNYG